MSKLSNTQELLQQLDRIESLLSNPDVQAIVGRELKFNYDQVSGNTRTLLSQQLNEATLGSQSNARVTEGDSMADSFYTRDNEIPSMADRLYEAIEMQKDTPGRQGTIKFEVKQINEALDGINTALEARLNPDPDSDPRNKNNLDM